MQPVGMGLFLSVSKTTEYRLWIRLTIVSILAVAVAGLGILLRPAAPTEFDTALRSHVSLSMSLDARLTQQVVVRKERYSVIAEWDIESEGAWSEYKQLIERGLNKSYVKVNDSETEILFRQTNYADIFELRLTVVPGTSPMAVNVKFSVSPW